MLNKEVVVFLESHVSNQSSIFNTKPNMIFIFNVHISCFSKRKKSSNQFRLVMDGEIKFTFSSSIHIMYIHTYKYHSIEPLVLLLEDSDNLLQIYQNVFNN